VATMIPVTRAFPEGHVPLVSVEGTAYEAGVQLGYVWKEALTLMARRHEGERRAWWMERRFEKLILRYAPHLPDLFRGMAKGAGLPPEQISHPAPVERTAGCTSFALQPRVTLDRIPISGQTKDTGPGRWFQFQVLRLKLTDAPSMLTLTYQGWLFGHGFVEGGCAIFRNSLYVPGGEGELPFSVWGLLATHCRCVEDVVELTRRHPIYRSGHCTVADAQGGIVGLELGRGGPGVLRPKGGIYTHANAVVGLKRMQRHEKPEERFNRANSLHRESRLRERLAADRGRLTAQLALMAMTDHAGLPGSLCRHQAPHTFTTSAVVAEPTRGLLHVTRGNPCQNWPRTYSLQP